MNHNFYLCYDFETGGKDPRTCEITQIAAVAIDPYKLEIVDSYASDVKPFNMDTLEQEALDITKKTKEQIETYPSAAVVWPQFASFIKKYDKAKTASKSTYNAPIPMGFNIVNYDMILFQRYCEIFKNVDGEGKQNLMNGVYKFDILDVLWNLWNFQREPSKTNLAAIKKYMGFSQESMDNAHNAIQDVSDTAAIGIKLLQLFRNICPKIKFENSFATKA